MDTPIKREADMLSDDISERHGLQEPPHDGKITTADFAGIRPDAANEVTAEPFREPAPFDDTLRSEDKGDDKGGVVAPASAPATRNTVAAGSAATATATAMERETGPLFSGTEANELRAKWDVIQVGFVDEPRGAVQQADQLVAATMKRLAEVFAAERGKLEGQWDQGENVSTEDLRQALRRYRSFFGRLLAI